MLNVVYLFVFSISVKFARFLAASKEMRKFHTYPDNSKSERRRLFLQ